MKLRNKKTGEIKAFDEVMRKAYKWNNYNSLAELNDDWEDYEEPKKYWFISEICAGLQKKQDTNNGEDRFNKEICNYFETKEEAEKAVEKLKAWKRLKDKGFEFEWVDKNTGSIKFAFFNREGKITKEIWQDIDLLFGGEE